MRSGLDFPWADLGNGLGGTNGVPVLEGSGDLSGNSSYAVTLTNALPSGTTNLVVGLSQLNVPFKGGVLVPNPDAVLFGLPLDGGGSLVLAGTWPTGVPSGIVMYLQHWISDGGGFLGWAASNGLSGTTP